MNRRNFLQALAASGTLPLAGKALAAGGTDMRPSHRPIQPWYQQAGLGLFLHWGPSSVGQIEISWGMYQDSAAPNPYWPVEKYYALADRFDPQNYDPNLWMEAAARAGMKYCVLTTRHHDGYALWPSDYGTFSTRQKLQGRDLVQPYVDACRKHGLKVGFYYSPTDWHYDPPGWPNRAFPHRDPDMHHSHPQRQGIPKWVDMPLPEMQQYFDQFYIYVKGQVGELLTRYGAIDLLWWDGYDWPPGIDIHGDDMDRYTRELQPQMVQNDRDFIWGPHKPFGDFNTDFEAKNPARRPAGPWEQCEPICGGWSYHGENAPCKSAGHIIERLVRNRTWGGNYLPDFGPRADGTMSPKYYALCDEVAAWMKPNQVSVYDVSGGPFPEQCDVPVTVRDNVWYVHFLSRQRSARLKQVNEPRTAMLLRSGESVQWQAQADGGVLTLPAGPPTELDEVVELTWK